MSIQSEINRIAENVANTYAAIRERGGTVPEEAVSDNLASAVSTIPAGASGPVQWEDINGRPDLSNVSSMKSIPIALNRFLWDDFHQLTIPVNDVIADEEQQLIIVKPKRTSRTVFNSCGIELADKEDGALVFACKTVPEEDVSVNAFIFGAAEVGEEYAGEFAWWSPQMTSENTPQPYVVSSNSVYPRNEANLKLWGCFDGVPSTDFYGTGLIYCSAEGDGDYKYVQIDLGSAKIVNAFKVNPAYAGSNTHVSTPNRIVISASNDGEKFIDIFADDSVEWAPVGQYSIFDLEKPVKYRYYRFGARNLLGSESFNGRVSYGDIQFSVMEGSV